MATPSLQAISREERRTDAYRVLGVRVDAVQIGDVIQRMEEWIERREAGHTIAVTGMHGVMEGRREWRKNWRRDLRAGSRGWKLRGRIAPRSGSRPRKRSGKFARRFERRG